MKALLLLPILILPAILSSCTSAGYGSHVGRDIITPSASAKTTERYWDENNKPHQKEIENDPAFLGDD